MTCVKPTFDGTLDCLCVVAGIAPERVGNEMMGEGEV